MQPARLIAAIRDGSPVSAEDLRAFAAGLGDGSVTDAQGGAFAMAVVLKGLGEAGRVALTEGMRDSGDRLHWDLPGPVLDKHSTGGIGDCISLLLAPAVAACGAYVPMISGRGLGHTGGTLDKLEAIPGLKTQVGADTIHDIVSQVGCAIVSATDGIAPADKRLYAIRDVTGTVESIDLITASILAKKLAAGLDALVLDVKVGSGAFMKTIEDAEDLARSLVTTANGAGCRTTALITDMNQPCAMSVGNALEVIEVMEVLTGGAVDPVLWDLTAALGGELLSIGGLASSSEAGTSMIEDALRQGHAAERFGAMIAAMGGPADFVDRWRDRLPAAPIVHDVTARQEGHVVRIDGQALGFAVVEMGGGRRVETDRVDPTVGLSDVIQLGVVVGPDTVLCRVHAANETDAEAAAATIRAAIEVGPHEPDLPPLIHKRIGA